MQALRWALALLEVVSLVVVGGTVVAGSLLLALGSNPHSVGHFMLSRSLLMFMEFINNLI